jgi:hypothetical protein
VDLADLLELGGLGTFVLGIYWLTGRGGAALAGAVALLFLGFSMDESYIYPFRTVRNAGSWLWKKVKRDRA